MLKLKLWIKYKMRRLVGIPELKQQNEQIMSMLRNEDQNYRDLIDFVAGEKSIRHNKNIKLVIEHPVAYDSLDHTNP